MIDSGTKNGKSVVIWFNDRTLAAQINKEYKNKFGDEPVQYKEGHNDHVHVIIEKKGNVNGWITNK